MAMKNGLINEEGNLPEELTEVLQSLAAGWGDGAIGGPNAALEVVQLTGGLNNQIYRVSWPAAAAATEPARSVVLVRVYGNVRFFDRADEIRAFEFVGARGLGPRLLGQFSGGRVEEFIHGRTLRASDLRNPAISARIAAKVREFHSLKMPGPQKTLLWDNLRMWLSEAKRVCSPEDAEAFRLDLLEEEIRVLERELPQEIVFCHNDLFHGNIMMDEGIGSITLIDYEYTGYNPMAYDLALHFSGMMSDLDSSTPHIVHLSEYPDIEERRRFVRAYLRAGGSEPSEEEVEQLINDIERHTLAAHLVCGLWAIISGYETGIDFDYFEHARQKLHCYWLNKPALLGSPTVTAAPDNDNAAA